MCPNLLNYRRGVASTHQVGASVVQTGIGGLSEATGALRSKHTGSLPVSTVQQVVLHPDSHLDAIVVLTNTCLPHSCVCWRTRRIAWSSRRFMCRVSYDGHLPSTALPKQVSQQLSGASINTVKYDVNRARGAPIKKCPRTGRCPELRRKQLRGSACVSGSSSRDWRIFAGATCAAAQGELLDELQA